MTVKYGAAPSGYTWVRRQLTSPGAPVTARRRPPISVRTASYRSGTRSQVQAVSKVSTMALIRARPSRRYGMRRNAERQEPTAGPALPADAAVGAGQLDRLAPAGRRPARAPTRSRGPGRCCPSVPAPDSAPRPGRAAGSWPGTARTARSPAPPRRAARRSPKLTDADALCSGRCWSRIHASVITPSVPSEPRNSRSGDGPAPEPGSRHDSLIPAGVTTRSDSTKSSMWVWSVA